MIIWCLWNFSPSSIPKVEFRVFRIDLASFARRKHREVMSREPFELPWTWVNRKAALVTSLEGWRNTKCVSQSHKTWFYYDYTTNTTNTDSKANVDSQEVYIIIWWSNFGGERQKSATQKMYLLCFHVPLDTTGVLRCVSVRRKISPRIVMKYDSNYIGRRKKKATKIELRRIAPWQGLGWF